jgi:RimJ/RimL family protein N-acetyltransferase
MDLRRADANDVTLLASWNLDLIRDEGHRNPMSVGELADRMRRWLCSEYTALVFCEGDTPVGYALYRSHEEGGIHLRQFFVARDRRRRGLGSRALELLVESVAPGRVVVEVLTNNWPAIAFWHAARMSEYARTLELRVPGKAAAVAPTEDVAGFSGIELVPVQAADARLIYESWGQHRSNFTYLTASAFESLQDAERYVSTLFQNEQSIAFHILEQRSRSIAGLIKAIVTEHRALVGFVIHEPYWGLGFATEAVQRVTAILEGKPPISRIWATCALPNLGSSRVLEKCGYVREGILKNWVTYPAQGGKPFDNYSYVKPNAPRSG